MHDLNVNGNIMVSDKLKPKYQRTSVPNNIKYIYIYISNHHSSYRTTKEVQGVSTNKFISLSPYTFPINSSSQKLVTIRLHLRMLRKCENAYYNKVDGQLLIYISLQSFSKAIFIMESVFRIGR